MSAATKRPPRLVPRALLERIADELTEHGTLPARIGSSESAADAFALLVTANDRDVNAGGYMVQELLKLAVRRAVDMQPLTDPPGATTMDPARVRACLLNLVDCIELARDMAEAVLGATVLAEGEAAR